MDNSVRDNLIIDNQALVYFIYNKINNTPLTERLKEDLIGEGMIGLCKAANTFDESRGVKFSTYATMCIRNEMLMFIRRESKAPPTVSLNEPIGRWEDGTEFTLADTIEDETNTEQSVLDHIMLEDFIQRQSGCDRAILKELQKGTPRKDVGKALGIKQTKVTRRLRNMRKKF